MNTKRPFADDKPGTSLGPRPKVCVSCSIRGPRGFTSDRPSLTIETRRIFRGNKKHNQNSRCNPIQGQLPIAILSPRFGGVGATSLPVVGMRNRHILGAGSHPVDTVVLYH